MDLSNRLYWYKATLVSITDGDTIRVDIDLGLDIVLKDQRIRLAGIDAPELRGSERKAGLDAKRYLTQLLPSVGESFMIHTDYDKRGSFSRLLAEIYVDGVNINRLMIESGYAKQFV